MPFDYSGSFSGSFFGDITSSNGVISSSAQVTYNSIQNRPQTITAFQKNSITAANNFRQKVYPITSGSISTRTRTTPTKIYHKEVYYRLEIWHVDLTHKIKTSPTIPGMVTHHPKVVHPPPQG